MITDSSIIEVGDKIENIHGVARTIRFVSSDGTIEFTTGQPIQFYTLSRLLYNGTCRLIKASAKLPALESTRPDSEPWPHPVFPC